MAKKLPSSENDVKDLIKQWFKGQGGFSAATPPGNGMGVHGIADRVGCVPITITADMVGKTVGLFVATEAKKPGRRGEQYAGATQAQVDYLRSVLDASGIAVLVDCQPDLDRLSMHLQHLRYPGVLTHAIVVDAFERRISGADA